MKKRRINFDLGLVQVDDNGLKLTQAWASKRSKTEIVLHAAGPYQLAFLAKHAVALLEQRKSEIESALRIARGQ